MKLFRTIISVFFLISVFSCSHKNSYQIRGKVTNAENNEIYLEALKNQKREIIDTVDLSDDGEFSMEGPIEEAGLFRIRDGKQKSVYLFLEPGTKIILEADLSDINNYTVKGSSESRRIKEFWDYISERNQKMNDLKKQLLDPNVDSLTKADVLTQMGEFDKKTLKDMKDRIQNEPNTLVGLLMIPLVNPRENIDFYNEFNERLKFQYPNSEYTKNFEQAVENLNSQKPIPSVGQEAPNITMENPQGEDLSLYSLKGNYVLLDFWAAWCGPCRRENPNLVQAYQKYHDKGFEIFSVSLDKTKQAWEKAIKDDKLTWPYHVSDLKFWSNAAAKQYGVRSIPVNFLIDPNGKIIATNLRGPELEDKLSQIFD